ncbi:hypothetical protein [Spirosoma rhododendri]|uniref:CHRD domain-containing protein n=1 Tax=Spirosoma rhododendri TaxID=2728024 RepID=A0A7L5DU74_9BACT|nr:hypothetical protein [Spirosoma rhododendri]QJD79110.1 hypothetical protein HH216_12285 [Spirosoma rhododendri]
MKRYTNLSFSLLAGILIALIGLTTACEQTNYEPLSNAAPGGGTVSVYKAYSLTGVSGSAVYGRVVFYKYSSSVTLVQMGLYNTASGTSYASSIYQGALTASSTTALKPLDAVSGATGAFATNKYYTISEAGFFDKLSTYNANVKIMAGSAVIASGNIGANATPVAQAQ